MIIGSRDELCSCTSWYHTVQIHQFSILLAVVVVYFFLFVLAEEVGLVFFSSPLVWLVVILDMVGQRSIVVFAHLGFVVCCLLLFVMIQFFFVILWW